MLKITYLHKNSKVGIIRGARLRTVLTYTGEEFR